jgi:lysophospholipase L1-like esterase
MNYLWMMGMVVLMGAVQAMGQEPAMLREPATKPDGRPTIWLIGDSTVRVGTAKQQGWGDPFVEMVQSDGVRVINKAIGGRSSRTFRTEGRWKEIVEQLRPGDVVLMQFGHNDSIAPDNPERPRGTLRGTGPETQEIIHPTTKQPEVVYTYGWYMRQYVIEAKAKGAIPVVVSLIPRGPRPADEKVFVPPTEYPTAGYAAWAGEVAAQEKAAFVDLNQLVLKSYAGMTSAQIKAAFFTDSETDFTHTGPGGAEHNARIVLQALRDLKVAEVDRLLPRAK